MDDVRVCRILVICLGLICGTLRVSLADTFWESPRRSGALVPRLQAPDFNATAVVDEKFATFSLQEYRGKWLVLFFYPFDFTFVCPTEVKQYIDRTNSLMSSSVTARLLSSLTSFAN